jgi:hypothetical protein
MQKQGTIITLAALAGLGLSAQATAAGVEEIKYDSEVKACVAEIRGSIDYTGASRVRHDVVLVKRRLVGYAMKIDTAVYGDTDDSPREYATWCVVNGNHKPLKFEISEVSDARLAG